MSESKLKLYVWHDVFRDYSAGLALAVAHDAEEARDLIRAQMGYNHEDLALRPDVYDLDVCEPFAAYVYGGS